MIEPDADNNPAQVISQESRVLEDIRNKSNRFLIITLFISCLTLLIATIYLKYELDLTNTRLADAVDDFNDMNDKFNLYQSHYDKTLNDLKVSMLNVRAKVDEQVNHFEDSSKVFSTNITMLADAFKQSDLKIEAINSQVDQHDQLLVKLSNRTSNAEVLDKLKTTQDSLMTAMVMTKSQVAETLDMTSRNVSIQLDNTRKEVGKSVVLMKHVILEAEGHIYGVQQNVTDQLDLMTKSLNHTVENLNVAVMLAQATIHNEVNEVKNKIEEYVLATNVKFAAENDFVKYQLAGTFTLLGCLISLWHMTSHLRHYEKPDVQRRIMAVLWMVPIYGVTSWLSLVFDQFEVIFAAFRDCYEAYAVYTFIALLIAVLEDGKGLPALLQMLTRHVIEERREVLEASNAVGGGKSPPKEHIKPPCPCCYVHHKPSSVAAAWLYQCKLMAMQFVIMKPVLTALPVIIELCGIDYHGQPLLRNGYLNLNAARVYIIILQNLSVAIAFYGLLSFYHGTEKDLAWCDPWPKFLCIKGVVFMTFWQGAALQAMSTTGWVDDRVSSQIQNLLICIEMLLASIAHFYIFPYNEWQEGYKRSREQSIAIRDTLALKDFYKDMRQMVTRWEPSSAADPPSTDPSPNKVFRDLENVADDPVDDCTDSKDFLPDDSGTYESYASEDNVQISSVGAINPLFPPYALNFEEYYQSRNQDFEGSSSGRKSVDWYKRLRGKSTSGDEQETTALLQSEPSSPQEYFKQQEESMEHKEREYPDAFDEPAVELVTLRDSDGPDLVATENNRNLYVPVGHGILPDEDSI